MDPECTWEAEEALTQKKEESNVGIEARWSADGLKNGRDHGSRNMDDSALDAGKVKETDYSL
jgi:hypothetical protein